MPCPRVNQRSQGQSSPPLPWLQAEKQSPAWTGEGQSPRRGSVELSELAKPVALKGGSTCAPSSGGHEGVVLGVTFSVTGPDEALFTMCRRAG